VTTIKAVQPVSCGIFYGPEDDAFAAKRWQELGMAAYPEFKYSMGQVRRAGEALKGTIHWDEERADEILEIFAIANSWRDSHAYPMNRLRQELVAKMRSGKLQGLTVARLKRMQSIRGKLARINANLHQIQDLGGCRAVLPSIADVRMLLASYEANAKHELHNQSPYIEKPKRGGYRCHHLIYKYQGDDGSAVFNGRRIEIQLRTRLQHAWATAVEAMGLFRKEDLKGGNGNPDWLRFFELMSAELAMAENCAESPENYPLPPHAQRVREIVDLDKKLQAMGTLENLRHAMRFTDSYETGVDSPKHYRIEYDNVSRQVRVTPHSQAIEGISENDAAEQRDNVSGENRINTVFIEADKIEDLKAGFPNYFGDVQLFTKNLMDITLGKAAKEYVMPPQETVPPPPKVVPDLSWFKRPKRWQ
jgi:hypothetical protein